MIQVEQLYESSAYAYCGWIWVVNANQEKPTGQSGSIELEMEQKKSVQRL